MKLAKQKILITGATDGIGLATARMLTSQKRHLLLHGRDPEKLQALKQELSTDGEQIETYTADLSYMPNVKALAKAISANHTDLDILINNAGACKVPKKVTQEGLDIRFAVNTIAPYLLTQQLIPLMQPDSRIINVSSRAQSPVDLDALIGRKRIAEDFTVYAQSKLALTMWSRYMALKEKHLTIVAVNPGSMLDTKMVQKAFGVGGHDARIGAEILTHATLSEEFATASGKYFDNDARRFAQPHADALNPKKTKAVVRTIETILAHIH